MRTLTSRPALRWLVPLGVLLAVVASFLVSSRASADAPLPPISAQDLLEKVADAKVDGLSGTVVQNADLGVPAVPGDSGSAGGKLTSLLTGTHTVNVWYSSSDKARLAIKDRYAETDVVSNGSEVWMWDSRARKATHTKRPAATATERTAPEGAPQTPQDAAKQFLAKVTPTTDVRVDPEVKVAGEAAYELVMTPHQKASLVKQVRIAVAGRNYVPLRVQVFGPDDKVALDITYTDITFGPPDPRMFEFTPPKGTTVTEKSVPERKAPTAAQKKELESRKAQAERDTVVVGHDWTAVVVRKLRSEETGSSNETLKGFLHQLPKVSGSWGTGRVLRGTIVTAILTDDGRLAAGPVDEAAVAQALAR